MVLASCRPLMVKFQSLCFCFFIMGDGVIYLFIHFYFFRREGGGVCLGG